MFLTMLVLPLITPWVMPCPMIPNPMPAGQTDMIPANVSNITRRAYDHICSLHRFVLRSNHDRLRLKQIELKRIRFDELLARICQDVRDDVPTNVCAPVNIALGDDLSNDPNSDDGWIDRYDSD